MHTRMHLIIRNALIIKIVEGRGTSVSKIFGQHFYFAPLEAYE